MDAVKWWSLWGVRKLFAVPYEASLTKVMKYWSPLPDLRRTVNKLFNLAGYRYLSRSTKKMGGHGAWMRCRKASLQKLESYFFPNQISLKEDLKMFPRIPPLEWIHPITSPLILITELVQGIWQQDKEKGGLFLSRRKLRSASALLRRNLR